LKLQNAQSEFARFRAGPSVRAGQSVIAVGFPLRGLLSSGVNVTWGMVSALAGMGDDTRYLQLTAPVQPGNSGGPVLDQSGNVVGVVVSKLNALKVAKMTGDIPQNVNFAIKGTIVQGFLDANGVEYGTAPSTTRLDTENIAELASKFTLVIECWK
jgi:S1-C subfamily serine protease